MHEHLLVKRAQSGDRDALEELFRAQYPVLKGFFIKLTADEPLAEDITQEAMLRAVLNLGKYRPESKFSTWLVAVGLNVYRNYLRGRHETRPLEEAEEMVDGNGAEGRDEVETVLNGKEIQNLLAGLPEEKKRVFLLKNYYGLKYEEIAGILNCPVGTVRSRLHDTLVILRREAERRGIR